MTIPQKLQEKSAYFHDIIWTTLGDCRIEKMRYYFKDKSQTSLENINAHTFNQLMSAEFLKCSVHCILNSNLPQLVACDPCTICKATMQIVFIIKNGSLFILNDLSIDEVTKPFLHVIWSTKTRRPRNRYRATEDWGITLYSTYILTQSCTNWLRIGTNNRQIDRYYGMA